jgi:hypothetical protein
VELVFSWFADSGAWPEFPGDGIAALDQEVAGPLRLLDHVETMLGLGRPGVAAVQRIAIYRRKIEACGPGRFWSDSFALDPWSSTRELLRWRDELIEAGWRPGMGSARRRLADLSAAEKAGHDLPLGQADRLRIAIDSLQGMTGLRLRSISLIDSRDTLPVGWRALVGALERCGVRVEQLVTKASTAAATCDLGMLLDGDRSESFKRDGSLTLLTSDTELAAAEAVAAWLAADPAANAGVTLVLGKDTALLDHALANRGLPRLGMPAELASPSAFWLRGESKASIHVIS